MARKREKNTSGGASWINTYSDLVTLLLTFFILLYAMSVMDAQKYANVVKSITSAFNPSKLEEIIEEIPEVNTEDIENMDEIVNTDETEGIDILYNMLSEYVNNNNLSESVEVYKSEEYVFIRFSDNITFGGYSTVISNQGKEVLDVLAKGLDLVDEYIEEVIIAGHTAEVENDNSKIDRKLSTDRANVVLEYLESKRLIDPSKYLAIGYGLYSPIDGNDTSEGRAKNRRVEIYISRKGYPISYTNKIKETINNKENSGINFESNSINNSTSNSGDSGNSDNLEYIKEKVIE